MQSWGPLCFLVLFSLLFSVQWRYILELNVFSQESNLTLSAEFSAGYPEAFSQCL